MININNKKDLEVIFSQISEALSKGDNVEIRGFGTYKIIKSDSQILITNIIHNNTSLKLVKRKNSFSISDFMFLFC